VPLDAHREATTKAGRRLAKLGEGDEVIAVEVAPAGGKLLLATSQGYAAKLPVDDIPALAAAGKGKRGIELEKKDRVVGATTGDALTLETTRGAEDELKAKDVKQGAVGDAGVVVKQRGGFTRARPRPPELIQFADDGSA
jgi:DNA gyrase subunit A